MKWWWYLNLQMFVNGCIYTVDCSFNLVYGREYDLYSRESVMTVICPSLICGAEQIMSESCGLWPSEFGSCSCGDVWCVLSMYPFLCIRIRRQCNVVIWVCIVHSMWVLLKCSFVVGACVCVCVCWLFLSNWLCWLYLLFNESGSMTWYIVCCWLIYLM